MPSAPERQLARLRDRYQQHAVRLAKVGFLLKGSVGQRFLPCGSPGCRCHADPPQLHGPYWQWTSKVSGKTVSRMLSEEQARRYLEWIENAKQFEQIVNELHDISSRADALLRARERVLRKRHDTSRARTQSGKSAAQR